MNMQNMRNIRKMMKKVFLPAVFACVLTLALAVNAMAELVPAKDTYNVSFKTDNKMSSNFKSSDMFNQAAGLQPGDYTDIVLNLKNENEATVDWYMTNKVLNSLEDTRPDQEGLAGGAYTYVLTFKNTTTGQERVLFSSDTVGGEIISEAGEGLHEATSALERDWLYLDTFAKNEGGTITLRVALDGETQGNDYQDTLAELQMNFAVELNETEPGGDTPPKKNEKDDDDKPKSSSGGSSSVRKTTVVKTGDETNSVPYLIAAGVSGLVLLILAVYSLRERRRQRGGEA